MNTSTVERTMNRRAIEALRNGVPNEDAVRVLGCDQPEVEPLLDLGQLGGLAGGRIEVADLLEAHDQLQHVLDTQGLTLRAKFKHALTLSAIVGRPLARRKLELDLDDLFGGQLGEDISFSPTELQLAVTVSEAIARTVMDGVRALNVIDELHDRREVVLGVLQRRPGHRP